MNSFQLSHPYLSTFAKNWCWFFIWGIVLLILGIIAISVSTLTTLISVIFLGILLLISGIVIFIDSFKFWWGKWDGFILHLIMSILYIAVGITLIQNPISSSISLTLLLGIFYLVIGLFRIIYSLSSPLPKRGLSFFNSIISLLIGILILASWPASSLFIIGLFIGVDLIVCGWMYIMMALTAKTMVKNA